MTPVFRGTAARASSTLIGAAFVARLFTGTACAAAQSKTASADRRDPFLSVVSMTPSTPPPLAVLKRGEGLARYTVKEISVRGVMQGGGTLLAIVQGPDKRSYVVHQGDRLADGFVRSITSQGLVLVQNISESLPVQQHQEILKLLRSLEDGKE
jgi:Tfp pilus assembly protein PilP